MVTTIFVYGTLMPQERNAHFAGPTQTYSVQPATLTGFSLWHLSPENYPAILPDNVESTVRGYALTYSSQAWPTALKQLDDLEGIDENPPLYIRELLQITFENGAVAESWVYIYARPERLSQSGAVRVLTGNWQDRA